MGGTGILKPAVGALGRSGVVVTVVARGAQDDASAGVHAAAVDATDTVALVAGLDAAIAARGPFALALVYAPFAAAASVQAIAERVPGTLTHVLTSRWGAPEADRVARDAWAPDGPGQTRRLTLGWTASRGAAGATRWHTPGEVSAAALATARGARSEVVLGVLRPWSDMPRT